MSLSPGTRLGPYQISDPIGAGGMGEVYRARDTRLDRTVAIKILLPHMADRADVRDRFEREARTIASLNHPHICVLHDVGQQDGMNYLVMEYLEGETLAHRLHKGPLPLEETLRYAAEIADALDKAHAKNITHRDLKPGNIMLTKSGTKLLDFGLAKLKKEAAPPAVPMSQLPTLTNLPTAVSGVVGTLQYMAPEQLEGKELDGRTDIFAFGAVLYEMATGKKAFEGTSQASLISAILTASPAPISAVQPMTPVSLDRVVRKCLAKEPEKRWQTASDLSDELKWIAQGGSDSARVAVPPQEPAPAKSRHWLPMTALAAVVLAIVAASAMWLRRPAPAALQQVSRFSINLAAGERLAATDFAQPALAISPDGKRLVYAASRNGGLIQLYLRGIDNLDAKPIADTDGASNPVFSPDGQWIAFFAGSMLKKTSISGGNPVDVAPVSTVSQPSGVTWGTDGTIIFGSQFNPALQQVSANGGTPTVLAGPDLKSGETAYGWPSFLPGSKGLLYSIASGNNAALGARIAVRPLAGGDARIVIPSGERPSYAPSGHLIYNQSSTLMAVPFDINSLQVAGSPVAVVNGVWRCNVCNGGAQYSFSDNGTLAYIPGTDASVESTMIWVDRNGKETPLDAPARAYTNPRVSPDGRTIAADAPGGVWTYDLARDTLTRLNPDANNPTAWTSDGKRIAFQMSPQGKVNIFWQNADGSGQAERLATSDNRQAAGSFSRNGQFLVFNEQSPVTGADLWIMRMSDHSVQPFIQTRADQGGSKFSPDGRWLAYTSDESGRKEIYVQPFPGPGGKHQISSDGGVEPTWNPNGREMFYRNGDNMMAVEISMQPVFSAGKPRMLWSALYRRSAGNLQSYDIAPDGQRFLMLKSAEQPATQINVVLNWFEELKQKVRAGKQ